MSSCGTEALARELHVATTLALQAGVVLLRHRAAPVEVLHKENHEVVTAADRESDALIREGLAAAFPDDAVFSEETADSPERLARRRVWIVDPLDGTSNFIAGGDEFSISIGLAIEGIPVLGVVCNPSRGELYAGGPGAGVTLNGSPVHPSAQGDLGAARVSASRKEAGALGSLIPCRELVPLTSMAYKLARVAAGLEDGAVSRKRRKEWGTCAGAALVAGAGGCLSLLDGAAPRFNRAERLQPSGYVAAGRALHGELLAAMRPFAG